MKVLYMVGSKVLFVDSVQTLDVGIPFMFERREVEGCRLFNLEPISSSLMKRLSNRCGIPCDFLGDAAVID